MELFMKSFVVIGLGRFGSNLACTLYELGHEVLGVDENEDNVKRVADHITHAIIGDPKDESVLQSIGVRNFDCTIVSLSSDIQSSVLVTLMLKEMGVEYVVAKAQSEIHARVLAKVGADRVVFPEKDMGMRLAQSLSRSNILEYIELSDEYSIVEIKVPAMWVGKTLRQLNVRGKYNVNIVGIRHHSPDYIEIAPNADSPFNEGEILVIIGSNKDVDIVSKIK